MDRFGIKYEEIDSKIKRQLRKVLVCGLDFADKKGKLIVDKNRKHGI